MSRLTITLIIVSLSSFSLASGDSKLSYGGYIKSGYYSAFDPDGDSSGGFSVVPALKMSYDFSSRGQRLYSTIEYTAFSTKASENKISQQVSGFSLGAGWEKKFAVSRSVKLWLGIGGFAGEYVFENRYRLAGDGYLDATFADREETLFGVSLTADTYFDISNRLRLGVGAYYDIGFQDGFQSVGLSTRFEFR